MNASARSPERDSHSELRSPADEAVRIYVAGDDPDEALLRRLNALATPIRLDVAPLTALAAEPPPDLFVSALPCPEALTRRLRTAALRFPYPEVLLVDRSGAAGEQSRRGGYQLAALRQVSEAELATALDEIVRYLVPLKRLIVSLVGRMPLKDVQRVVRSVMVLHALSRGNGSRRLAARTLGVTRPAVQQMLAGLGPLERRP